MGAVARAMGNFGFSRLRVVNPYETAFREARSAVGASSILARSEQYENLADAVADCSLVVGTTAGQNRDVKHELTPLHPLAGEIREHLGRGRVALLFGSEKRGLSNQDFTHCHKVLRIPTREEQPSMNLGQAAAVCLYEIARERSNPPATNEEEMARSGDLEQITSVLFELLSTSGYVKPRSGVSSREKLRRLIRRLHLEAIDAQVLLGMLRKILWKVESASRRE